MIPISALSSHVGEVVQGLYELREPQWRNARNGIPFFSASLQDHTGRLRVYGWPPEFQAGILAPDQLMSCRLQPRRRNDGLVADMLTCCQRAGSSPRPLERNTLERLPLPSRAGELRMFLTQCPVPALRAFLKDVFTDKGLRNAFLSLPASHSHHHAWPGGLAAHSLEVAAIVHRALGDLDESERWLACVAGLLHDIGKLRTLQWGGRRTTLGYLVDHEQLTLETLAPALGSLDRTWPDGGTALRYLLTWRRAKSGARPLLPAALALEFADRLSNAGDIRDDLFKDRPAWQRFVRFRGRGPQTTFWRPRLP